MKIYIVGVGCVGKTTIGELLAKNLGYSFYDLDQNVEDYYGNPIEIIQNESYGIMDFREKASIVLDELFSIEGDAVIAGTISGLTGAYLRVYKRHKKTSKLISVHLYDNPENILERLTFYDENSQLMQINLTDEKRKKYLRKIKADYTHFKKSLQKADLQFNIDGLPPNKIIQKISKILNSKRDRTSKLQF
jgi:shikimate kinase